MTALTLLCGAAFALFLMLVVGWGFLPMLAVMAGFCALALLHYLVWGRNLERQIVAPQSRVGLPNRPGTRGR